MIDFVLSGWSLSVSLVSGFTCLGMLVSSLTIAQSRREWLFVTISVLFFGGVAVYGGAINYHSGFLKYLNAHDKSNPVLTSFELALDNMELSKALSIARTHSRVVDKKHLQLLKVIVKMIPKSEMMPEELRTLANAEILSNDELRLSIESLNAFIVSMENENVKYEALAALNELEGSL